LKAKLQAQAQEAKDFKAALHALSENPEIEQFLLGEIHRTVTHHDDHVVNVALHAGLSAYCKPLNLALRAESGSGKSYSTTQTLLFMPQEDVMYIASQSPKVISHENGVKKVVVDGEEVLFDSIPVPQKPERSDEPDLSVYQQLMKNYAEDVKRYKELERNCFYEVDLRNKVIIFLEGVSTETFKMFKATMSHDNEENGYVDHKYVDDKGRVHKTRLVGAPCLIFNSLDTEYVSEFATRCLTATPSTSKDKIAAAMEISNRRSSYPWEYEKESFNRRLIREYIRRIRDTLQLGKISVVNPFIDLHKSFGKEQTRSMRDFNKYLELLGPYAMFKLFQRPVIIISGKRYLVPTIQDALNAKAAFDAILQTTQTGTEQRVISFYWEIVINNPSATVEQLTDLYNKNRKHKVSTNTIRAYLKRLVDIEWVDERESEHESSKGYIDKRFKTYLPLKQSINGSNLKFEVDLKANLEKSFKEWLKNVTAENLLHPQIIIPRIDGTAQQISAEELNAIALGNEFPQTPDAEDTQISVAISKTNPQPAAEKGAETPLKPQKEPSEQNSEPNRNSSKETHYRLLAPNEPHPCDYYGCVREAQYQVAGCYFCNGKDVSHFKEMLAKNIAEGFTNIEDPLDSKESLS
jgi:hypothetical protein